MLAAMYCLHTGGEPFFRDILVHRKTGILLKQMGDMILAQIKLTAQRIKAQIAAQILMDIISNTLIA